MNELFGFDKKKYKKKGQKDRVPRCSSSGTKIKPRYFTFLRADTRTSQTGHKSVFFMAYTFSG